MKCRLSLIQIKTTMSKGSMQWGATINLYYNGKNIKNGKKYYFDI